MAVFLICWTAAEELCWTRHQMLHLSRPRTHLLSHRLSACEPPASRADHLLSLQPGSTVPLKAKGGSNEKDRNMHTWGMVLSSGGHDQQLLPMLNMRQQNRQLFVTQQVSCISGLSGSVSVASKQACRFVRWFEIAKAVALPVRHLRHHCPPAYLTSCPWTGAVWYQYAGQSLQKTLVQSPLASEEQICLASSL